jgi:hypothetical protein
MENQKLSARFLSILKDTGLILCPEMIVWNLFRNKSSRNIDFDVKYTRTNTFKTAHFKGLESFQSGAF